MTAGGVMVSEIGARLSPTLVALEELRSLLDGNDEVSIPGVVVTGAQSAGKSSVLESLAGIKLPRGQNITTRVPLILSLQSVPGAQVHALIGADASFKGAKTFDVADAGAEIESLTTELAGAGTGVRNTPIHLRAVRDSGPTLTLIDLPGITHNSQDKSQDIHAETVGLVKKYMKNDNMVILVVIPAMDDFANAEAVALAKEYDPEGTRTLGVVARTDNIQPNYGNKAKLQMDPGHVQLRLGFIAVVNRTPAEVESDAPAEQVRAREKLFFKTNPEVAGLEKELWGVDTLVKRIVGIQAERGSRRLARRRIKELGNDLRDLPKELTDENQRWDAFRMVLSRVRDQLRDMLTIGDCGTVCGEEVNIVPHVTNIYRAFANYVLEDVVPDFFSDEYQLKAREALSRVDGMALPNLLAGRVFNVLFREIFSDDLEDLSHQMVDDVRNYMEGIVESLFEDACEGYPVLLKDAKTTLVEEFMDLKREQTITAVSSVVLPEKSWMFTQNRAYATQISSVRDTVCAVQTSKKCSQLSAKAGHVYSDGTNAKAVGDVPEAFVQKMVDGVTDKDEEISKPSGITPRLHRRGLHPLV